MRPDASLPQAPPPSLPAGVRAAAPHEVRVRDRARDLVTLPQPIEELSFVRLCASEPWMLGLKNAVPVAKVMIAVKNDQ